MSQSLSYIYGPVMSRRLGYSLGVDLVPFKTCTYDCIYCQLGRTTDHRCRPQTYFSVDEIMSELQEAIRRSGRIDYISLAGSGEPTLNSQIGELVDRIKSETDIPMTVLTNGSLLWDRDIRRALTPSDVVLPSLDAGTEATFDRICRPCEGLTFELVVEGLVSFTGEFSGRVWLEVMLLEGINTSFSEMQRLSRLVQRIRPELVQLNTVVRPPSEESARAVGSERMQEIAGLIDGRVEIVAASSGESESPSETIDDGLILLYLRRRPTTADDIATGLNVHRNEISKRLQALIDRGLITTVRRDERVLYKMRSKDA